MEGRCEAPTAPESPGVLHTDANGTAAFCLEAGIERGEWTLEIEPVEQVSQPLEPHGQPHFRLAGRTVAGQAATLQSLAADQPVLCLAGQLSPELSFQVLNANDEPVPGTRVFFRQEGGIENLTRQLQLSDASGRVRVQAVCPMRLLQGGKVVAEVQEPPLPPAEVAIEVRADAVHRLLISPADSNPPVIRTGATLRYVVTAFDANDVPVLHPVGSDGPLQLRLAIASEGHAGTLRLPGGEALGGQVQAVDAEGRLYLDLTVQSRATPAGPILLAVRSLDGEVQAVTPINVSAGGPSALLLAPSGRVQAAVGGTAGTLTIQVLDGVDAATANGVPGVAVSLSAAAELTLDRTQGRTDAFGRFTSQILLVDRVGDHEIGVQASLRDWQANDSLTVEGTVGNVAPAGDAAWRLGPAGQ